MMLNCRVSLLVTLVVTVLQFSQNVSAAGTEPPPICDFDSPELLEFLGPVNECLDLHSANLLCWLQCFAEKIGVVDKKGNVNIGKLEELLAKLPEGNLKTALANSKTECLGKSRVIDVTRPSCQGYLKFGLCIVTVMKKSCDNLVQYFRDYTAQLAKGKGR